MQETQQQMTKYSRHTCNNST